jgi:hypothetical protein
MIRKESCMWRKISFCFLFLLLVNNVVFSQDSTNAFLDKVQKVIDVRRTFDSESEPKDPAIFTITKNSDEKTNYTIDLAILYKLFSTDEFYLRPVMQFYYSSSEKEPSERITGAWSAYWIFDNPETSSRSNRLEWMVSYSKDFKTELEKLGLNLVWVPTYPKFLNKHLPIRNATEIEYSDSGFDRNVLIHGFQPVIGLGYDKEVSDKGDIADVKSFRGIVKGQYSWRRYYFQLDLALNFENELINHKRTFFDYSAKTSFYFDDKERSSVNTSVEVIERPKIARNTKITFGFGLKL